MEDPSILDRIRAGKWRLPGDRDRTSIVGVTGSGKTQFAVYLMLASRLYEKMPWIVFDYKGDELIGKLPAREIDPRNSPPKDPGMYRLHLNPFDDPDIIKSFLGKVWSNGDTGLYFDEVYMLPDSRARSENQVLRALYTTGRSRRIPMMCLSQRPVDVIRYNFSEASHHVVFRLNDELDRKIVRGRVPYTPFEQAFSGETNLPKYHSFWYDVQRDLSFEMLPGPSEDVLMEMFEQVEKVQKWT
jgi:DNA helicase HerA-like ATPase